MSYLAAYVAGVSNHRDLREHFAGLAVEPHGRGRMPGVQVEPKFERHALEGKSEATRAKGFDVHQRASAERDGSCAVSDAGPILVATQTRGGDDGRHMARPRA